MRRNNRYILAIALRCTDVQFSGHCRPFIKVPAVILNIALEHSG